jgi:L-ascorbate 6-phosphate lactonase
MWWLCQAGFAFKTHAGKVVLIDPYLSDAVERLAGFKRLSLPPIAPEEVKADLVVLTHEHGDHLDPDALPVIVRGNPACRFAAPSGCTEGLEQAGVTAERRVLLAPGKRCDLGCAVIHAVAADHGDFSPSALSLLLDFDGVRILCAGDTSLRPETFKPLYDLHPDVLLPCINGVFGNMNHIDAAMMAQQAKPRIAIPCHYWMFAEQGGDPGAFLYACRHFCPEVKAMVLKPGEGLDVERRQA